MHYVSKLLEVTWLTTLITIINDVEGFVADNINTQELGAGYIATMFVSESGNGSVKTTDAWEVLMIFETSVR